MHSILEVRELDNLVIRMKVVSNSLTYYVRSLRRTSYCTGSRESYRSRPAFYKLGMTFVTSGECPAYN